MVKTMQKNLRLEEDRVRKLEEIAKAEDRSVSYEIRKAIDELIESHKRRESGGK